MNDWIWLLAMVLMGYFGFVFGVQYAWNRDRILPFIWAMTHGVQGLNTAARADREKPPWER